MGSWVNYDEALQMRSIRRWVFWCQIGAGLTQVLVCTLAPGTQATSAVIGPVNFWVAWLMYKRYWPVRPHD